MSIISQQTWDKIPENEKLQLKNLFHKLVKFDLGVLCMIFDREYLDDEYAKIIKENNLKQ